jgi:predicted PurR-regulated permease PerM
MKLLPNRPQKIEQPPTPIDGGTAADVSDVADVPVEVRAPVDVRNLALTAVAVIAGMMLLQYAQSVIIPIVLSILISYALDPPVERLSQLRMPRPVGAALVLLLMVATGGLLVYGLRAQATAVVEQLPQGARHLRRLIEGDRGSTTTSAIQQVQRAATELEKAADATAPPTPSAVQRVRVDPPPFSVGEYMMWGSIGLLGALGQGVLILFLTYFLLASGDLYRRKLVRIAGPSLTHKKITVQILSEIDRQIERFLLVQVFTSVIVAVASWLAFRALGLQQAGLWGLLAGIFNSIPYFGPVLVTAATATVAFLQFGNVQMPMLVGGAALAITSLEGMLLTPWLTSRAARMNAVAVFVGLLFWGWLWSVWGMLLAVPMLMVVKAISDHVEDLKPISELLGD